MNNFSLTALLSIILLCGLKAHTAYVKFPVSQHSWGRQHIRVCFDRPKGYFYNQQDPYIKIAKQWTQQEFAKAEMHITGWDTCQPNTDQQSIHIRLFEEEAGWTRIFGKSSAGQPSNINIFRHTHKSTSQSFYDMPLRHMFVHEILHSLGFFHEHDRRDNIKQCSSFSAHGKRGHLSALSLGDYDLHSIMNYCRPQLPRQKNNKAFIKVFDQHLARLSAQDIINLKSYMLEPIAELKNKPKYSSNLRKHTFEVTGRQLTHYRYFLSTRSSDDCKQTQHYSTWIPSSQPLSLDLKNQYGQFKLCLLGKSSHSTQNPLSYSSFLWFRRPVQFHVGYTQHSPHPITLPIDLKLQPILSSKKPFQVYTKLVSTFIDPRCRGGRQHPWACTNSCLNTNGYKKTGSLIHPSHWARLYRYQSSGTFKLCITKELKDLRKHQFHQEHIEIYNSNKVYETNVYGLSKQLLEGQALSLIVKSGSGLYSNYKWATAASQDQCKTQHFKNAKSIYAPLQLNYQHHNTRFLCLLLQDTHHIWSLKPHIIDLSNPDTFAYP